MKLNKLCEGAKFDPMWEWCSKNIANFRDLYFTDAIDLDNNSKIIAAPELKIDTRDEEIPYIIDVEYYLEIVGPNLKSFKNLKKLDHPRVVFNGQSKLNFNNLATADIHNDEAIRFIFSNYTSLEAGMFTRYNFDTLSFDGCTSNTLYDFSEYKNCGFILLYEIMYYSDINISNILFLLDQQVNISEVDFSYQARVGALLTKIVNRYLKFKDKENYTMDFTVEVLDNKFDENIL
jgi:hypothetical protein